MNISHTLTLIPGFIIGLTVHEFSHAWTASRLGDTTARDGGRLTLNPLAHLDVFGSLMLLFIGFGWAKPVPVDARNFRSPRMDMAMVAVAGPLANVVLAIVLAVVLRFALALADPAAASVSLPQLVLVQAVWINIVLAVFNLIPIPPLDGSRVIAGFLPEAWSRAYDRLEGFGPALLFAIVILANLADVSILGRIIKPVAEPLFRWAIGI